MTSTPPTTTRTVDRKPPLSLSQQRRKAVRGLVWPMLVVLFLVAGWPLLRTIGMSLTDSMLNPYSDIIMGDGETSRFDLRYPVDNAGDLTVSGDDGLLKQNMYQLDDKQLLLTQPLADGERLTVTYGARFVGLNNYVYLVKDPVWWQSVRNTLVFAFASVGLETVFGVLLALLMNAHFRGKGWLRAAILVPWAIPTIVSAQMWGWMYNDIYGIINAVLLQLGFIEQGIAWTANPDTALMAIVAVDVWKTTPFMALLVLAALQLVPGECYEAAKVDGIHPVTVFFRITLPMIWPALLVAMIFRLLDALRVFDLIYVLGSNSRDTMSMSVYVRQQLIDFGETGYGSAAATMLFMVIAGFTAVYLVIGRSQMEVSK